MLSLLRKAITRRRRHSRSRNRQILLRRVGATVFERLEERALLTSMPFGAVADDTAEYMLGDVSVTVVLMESQPVAFGEQNLEDWTDANIASTKARIEEGLQWWVDTLAQQPASAIRPQPLNFLFDYTYSDNPVNTVYEPISRISNDFELWIYDFLNDVVANPSGDFSTDIRTFNNSQRIKHNTDWAFTMFVVNSENDPDEAFLSGGSFSRAFAYSGGRFFVTPSERPPSTYAHEAGHMFWAYDEYAGSSSITYTARRGYYDTQNLNAADNPAPGFVHVDSIMSNGASIDNAYVNHTSSPTSLEMIGWRDSDGNGIFDVLDVPHTLSGSGHYDSASGTYQFVGSSSVQTLPNQNSSGLQNDITINKITRAQFRLDGTGPWQPVPIVYNTHTAALNLAIPVPADFTTIEIRTIDERTGVTSPIYVGGPDRPGSVPTPGISGFVRNDTNSDGVLAAAETSGLSGWTVELLDEAGQPLQFAKGVEPDDFDEFVQVNQAKIHVTLQAIGSGVFDDTVLVNVRPTASTGTKVFGHVLSGSGTVTSAEWTSASRNLRMDFLSPVSTVSLDAVSNSDFDYGRLEIYDANNRLLGRYTTRALASGQFETMILNRPTADIAYAIAKAHLGTAVQFDNLQFGPKTTAVTDAQGAYAFAFLPSGNYTVQATAPTGQTITTAASQTVTFAAGASTSGVDFGGSLSAPPKPWQNSSNRFDVDGSGKVIALDVFSLIAELRRNGPRQLGAPPTGGPTHFWDVSGDNALTSMDVFELIAHLRAQATAGNSTSGGSSGGGAGGSAGEGESAALDAALASLISGNFTYATEGQDNPAAELRLRDLLDVHVDYDDRDAHEHHDEIVVAPSLVTVVQPSLFNGRDASTTPTISLSLFVSATVAANNATVPSLHGRLSSLKPQLAAHNVDTLLATFGKVKSRTTLVDLIEPSHAADSPTSQLRDRRTLQDDDDHLAALADTSLMLDESLLDLLSAEES